MLGKDYGKSYEYECATVWTQLVNRPVGIVQYGIKYTMYIKNAFAFVYGRKKRTLESLQIICQIIKRKFLTRISFATFFISHSQSQRIPQS
jgi:hypothetical protein